MPYLSFHSVIPHLCPPACGGSCGRPESCAERRRSADAARQEVEQNDQRNDGGRHAERDFDLLFHGFYSIKVEAIYTLSILGQQVLDVHGRRVHDLPRILLRYGQRAGELAEDAAYPVVAVVVEPFDDGRPTSVTRKDGLRIFVVHLLVDVRDVEEEVPLLKILSIQLIFYLFY